MNKKKKMSLNDSHNKTLDGFFASSTANSSQDSSEDKGMILLHDLDQTASISDV